MTENKRTVERYIDGFRKSDHKQILACLADDVEWELPGLFRLAGKEAFDKEIENAAFVGSPEITITRLTEENDVVIAEGAVRCQRREGGFLQALFCDVFTMQNARIKHLVTYLVELKTGMTHEEKPGSRQTRRPSMTKAIPEGFHSVTPMCMFKDARQAIEFYKRAFGAMERFAMPGPGGKGVMHAELQIGNSIIMMGEEDPHEPCKSAETMGGSPVSFYIYLEDVDQAFRKALEAGAQTRMLVQDMFWGDRVGTVRDPFGYSWSLATHTKDLTPQELQEGASAAFAQMAKK